MLDVLLKVEFLVLVAFALVSARRKEFDTRFPFHYMTLYLKKAEEEEERLKSRALFSFFLGSLVSEMEEQWERARLSRWFIMMVFVSFPVAILTAWPLAGWVLSAAVGLTAVAYMFDVELLSMHRRMALSVFEEAVKGKLRTFVDDEWSGGVDSLHITLADRREVNVTFKTADGFVWTHTSSAKEGCTVKDLLDMNKVREILRNVD